MKTAIIIPARYGSTRFPGKPLAKIGGITMLQRVVETARRATEERPDVALMVATEDERIEKHCREIGIDCVMTPEDCPTGSDRVLEAARRAGGKFDVLIGLQGDAPFTPLQAIRSICDVFRTRTDIEVATPVVRLRWSELLALREAKKTTPFSGTTAIIDESGRALWFSKTIIPAIRSEENLKKQSEYSPVYQHIGLYGYRRDVLERFVSLPQSYYETLEGLEQLRLLENGIHVQALVIETDPGLAQAGIDSPEDIVRAEALLARLENDSKTRPAKSAR